MEAFCFSLLTGTLFLILADRTNVRSKTQGAYIDQGVVGKVTIVKNWQLDPFEWHSLLIAYYTNNQQRSVIYVVRIVIATLRCKINLSKNLTKESLNLNTPIS